jgi:hypothetical protein
MERSACNLLFGPVERGERLRVLARCARARARARAQVGGRRWQGRAAPLLRGDHPVAARGLGHRKRDVGALDEQ